MVARRRTPGLNGHGTWSRYGAHVPTISAAITICPLIGENRQTGYLG